MRRIATIVVLLALGSSARAEKRREVATYLSAGGAIASSSLVLASFFTADQGDLVNQPLLYAGLGTSLATPSLGEWYAGQWWTWGMAIRVAAVAFAVTAIATQQEDVTCDVPTASGQPCKQLSGPGIALAGAAAIAYIGGVAYDVLAAPDAVDRYNQSHFILTPAVMPTPSGAAAGLYFSAEY